MEKEHIQQLQVLQHAQNVLLELRVPQQEQQQSQHVLHARQKNGLQKDQVHVKTVIPFVKHVMQKQENV